MTLIILKSGEALSYSTINPPRFSELAAIEDLLIDEQLTLQDMYTLLFMYDRSYYKEKEEILHIIDRYCQFLVDECEANKIYMLAFYIDTVIFLKNVKISKNINEKFFSYIKIKKDEHKTQNTQVINEMNEILDNIIETIKNNTELQAYNKKINDILKQDIQNTYFNSLKGFYLLVNEKVEKSQFIFAQEKNAISEIGSKYIRNMRSDNINQEEFDNYFVNNICIENIILFIDTFTNIFENVTDKNINTNQMVNNINELKSIYNNVDVNILNFYIAKIYHIKKDYLNAKNYYCQSNHKNAIYNLMNITRHVIDDNAIYNEILNYIYLCNNKIDKINLNNTNDKCYQVYKTKHDEKWCGSALVSYFNLSSTNLIEKHVIWNNIAFYFVECLNEKETYFIEIFYDLLKKNNINDKNFDVNKLKKEEINIQNKNMSGIVMFCKSVIANKLMCYNDTVSNYNLSFLLKKEEAIKVLQEIQETHIEAQINLAFLLNDRSMLNSLENQNTEYYSFYTNYLQYKIQRECKFENYKNNTLNYFSSILQMACKIKDLHSDKINLEKLKNVCTDKIKENKDCIYFAFYYAYINYLDKCYNMTIKILNFILDAVKTSKNNSIKKVCDLSYLLIGMCYIKIDKVEMALSCFNKASELKDAKDLLRLVNSKK
ncbi:hypothetical protein BDAP_002136 [Binucleata daphniae]